jgi:purine-binding chemotaxis protein CheW
MMENKNGRPAATRRHRELIAFMVRQQEFCVDIQSIREIRGWNDATRLPHVPDYMVGVINLRGTILPIIDVARRFSMPSAPATVNNVIIVVQIAGRLAGMLVDSVSDILQVEESSIRPLPDVNSDMAREFLKQVVIHDRRIICEIALDRLFPAERLEAA